MKVLIARTSGFCDGVKRAMRIALSAAEKGELAADGPLVHNRQALEILAARGVGILDASGAAPGPAQILVRAHGVPTRRRHCWLQAGKSIVDATCIHVAENQRLAREAAAAGKRVLFAADPGHPETLAVTGGAGKRCHVIQNLSDIETLPEDFAAGGVLFLAQTTFNARQFAGMAAALKWRFSDTRIVDSICRATRERQEEAERLAAAADIFVVVGGRNSANTRRLAEAGRAIGKPAVLVETAADLNPGDFTGLRVAAVTAGASTPGWITQEVVDRLRQMGRACPTDYLHCLVRFLTESRLSTALAAAGLALAAERLLLPAVMPALVLAGSGYIFFAHILNRRLPQNRSTARLSPIDSFYQARRRGMLIAAWLSAVAGIALASMAGPAILFLFLSAILAASLYAAPAGRMPEILAKVRRFVSPRYWAMPAGWALILAGPPAWETKDPVSGTIILLFVFLMRLGGTLVRDLHDIASDSLLGIDTLSSRLGSVRAAKLATACLGAAALIPALTLFLAAREGNLAPDWILAVAPISAAPGLGLVLLELLRRRNVRMAAPLQIGVDGMCLLAGLPSLISLATGISPC
ncbi:MAG: 4-hydroxy-3-methylbut-2-enyl diphosphate reductase [Planctomycetota bacterium]|jgi:4-hydroxy-3-methylbut-2-enyl diphosphate reductase|nr:4-hydroxy-3-methylbut-2-enyl diphosphate reductase [Planctomycetota bacterium]